MATKPMKIPLAPTLDIAASEALREQFVDIMSKDRAAAVDASAVKRISTPCIQVIIAAGIESERRGQKLTIGKASPAFNEAFENLGLSEFLSQWGL